MHPPASPAGDKGDKVQLLHGTLHVKILKASNVPDKDFFADSITDCSCLWFCCPARKGEPNQSDPYVSVVVGGTRLVSTSVVPNCANPVWGDSFVIPVAMRASSIEFVMKDADFIGSQSIGKVVLPLDRLLSTGQFKGSLPVVDDGGMVVAEKCELELEVSFEPANEDGGLEAPPSARRQLSTQPSAWALEPAFFRARHGNRVRLYQDAHVPEGLLPTITLGGGGVYEPGQCWLDHKKAIQAAENFIFIADWSLRDHITLDRSVARPGEPPEPSLGELLRDKAAAGVKVLLLVWDDKTSSPLLKTSGVMSTGDEVTRAYFQNTKVECVLAGRIADQKYSFVRQQVVGTFYTHHQKTMVCDAPLHGGGSRLVSFLGGIDFTTGRWDTPEHRLFSTLEHEHAEDFRNSTFKTASVSNGGPRQPWHDLHCRIEGPTAHDVLANFTQRWRKSAGNLASAVEVAERLEISDAPVPGEEALWDWHVQVLRSIDSGSVVGFPGSAGEEAAEEVAAAGLTFKRGAIIDTSIHHAYVHAIRRASRFIYIENQYFLGSAFEWGAPEKNCGCNNLIPMEIALKVAAKIRAGEPFAAYIVIPLWPEGSSEAGATKAILNFQRLTMQAMYRIVADAIRESGLEGKATPRDYLNFFCLGTRNVPPQGEAAPKERPPANSSQAAAQAAGRFMVYVHAKMMVVDDEYVILGSANINQRSLAGDRDTELAMGAWQPQHMRAREPKGPRGQVFGFRMALWAEHCGRLLPHAEQPWSRECVGEVRALAADNWRQWAGDADKPIEMSAHLLAYPYLFGERDDGFGDVRALPGAEKFPDVGGDIVGARVQELPDNLTT